MLTTIEKVIFLQNVDVFADVPTEDLAYLAAIAEEIKHEKDDVIYNKDDQSDALYVVLDGKVQLHIDENVVTTAETNDAFGTWALFDEEPRVTTATPLEDSKLIRIDREDFYDLLSDHGQITQAIFKTIVKKFRGLVEKFETESLKRSTN